MKNLNIKTKIYIIIGIIVLILSIGGTFAWYLWFSPNSAIVNLELCNANISFVGGDIINGNNSVPVLDREEGIKKEVEVYLNKECRMGDSAVLSLYMTLDLLPVELQEETFIYEVVKDGQILASGNFKDKKEGDTMVLLSNEIITSNKLKYVVYIYIDGTRDNPITMDNKAFRFNIYSEGTKAIYEENVLGNYSVPTSSDSLFLDTDLLRSSIKSITLVENNIVPNDVLEDNISDISVNQDGSIILWYTDLDSDDLYDVYIGSKSGVIKANTSAEGMFSYLTNVESLDLSRLDTSNVTNMNGMFKNNDSLREIKLSNFDTSKVIDMKYMFYNMSSLTSLDLSNFNTSIVSNMNSMFSSCSKLTELDLSSFDMSTASNVTNMLTDTNSVVNAYARTENDALILNAIANKPSTYTFIVLE